MRRPGTGPSAARLIGAVVLVGGLTGCGTPSGLDHQEQIAFARACVSLIERGMSDDKPPRVEVLGNEDLNLDEASSFYSALERLRGPSTFDLHDPAHAADTARQPLDRCETKAKTFPSVFPPRSSTTTTTTVPGS